MRLAVAADLNDRRGDADSPERKTAAVIATLLSCVHAALLQYVGLALIAPALFFERRSSYLRCRGCTYNNIRTLESTYGKSPESLFGRPSS